MRRPSAEEPPFFAERKKMRQCVPAGTMPHLFDNKCGEEDLFDCPRSFPVGVNANIFPNTRRGVWGSTD